MSDAAHPLNNISQYSNYTDTDMYCTCTSQEGYTLYI